MLGACRMLAVLGMVGSGLLLAPGPAQAMPPACKVILSHMDHAVQQGGPAMHRYCGRFANGGEYVIVAYSSRNGRYAAYTASQSGSQNVEAAPATLKAGVLHFHSVIAGITRTVVVTYRLEPDRVLTRIARGTQGATIIQKTDKLAGM